MHMIDRRRQHARRGERIGAHPEQMAGIEVRADHRPDRIAQAEQRLDVVDVLLPVQLQAQLATPAAFASATSPFQYGISTSSHCHASTRAASGGQAVVTQLALASPGPPGQPDISTTRSTPSSPASRIVFDVTS